jgi:phosphodiesterase/alkaline phosphatase D-like protein
MLGDSQFAALTGWLERLKEDFPVKFIVTSTSFLSHLHLDFTNDRWSGFVDERDRLLSFLSRKGIEGVYFLAGDLHSAHAISAQAFERGGKPVTIWEFCSSPFEQAPFTQALFFDHPATSSLLQNQQRHFLIPHINYGLVSVEFDKSGNPSVRFEVSYFEFGRWKQQSVLGAR